MNRIKFVHPLLKVSKSYQPRITTPHFNSLDGQWIVKCWAKTYCRLATWKCTVTMGGTSMRNNP